MIVGSSLTIEIGDRALLRDASFVVGAGEKVALVGRNGTGKSSFISVVDRRGAGPPALHRQRPGHRAPSGTCPRCRPPRGLGLDPSGFSHVLQLPGPRRARRRPRPGPQEMAKDPTEENIALFTDLEEQFRENGGYEAESVMARLADGLGLRQELLLRRHRQALGRPASPGRPHPGPLPGARHHGARRAHQPPRPGGQAWLMDELAGFGGSPPAVSHDLKLLDHSITKVLHLADGRLHEFKGTYSSFRVQLRPGPEPARAGRAARSRKRSSGSRPWPTRCGGRPRSGPAWPSARQAGWTGSKSSAPRSTAASASASSAARAPPFGRGPARGARPGRALRAQGGARRRDLPPGARRPHGRRRAQRGRQVEPAPLPGRRAGAERAGR